MALTARLALLEDSITTYRSIAADGTATLDTLREALVRATDQLDTLKGMAIAYSVSVDSLKAAYAEERRAAIVALTKADAVIRMQDSVIYRLQRPLPRTQTVKVFAAGIGIGIAIAVLR